MSLLLFGHFLALDSFLKLNTKVQRLKHQDAAMKSPHLITLIKMPNQNLPSHPSSFWHRSPFLLKISIAKLFCPFQIQTHCLFDLINKGISLGRKLVWSVIYLGSSGVYSSMSVHYCTGPMTLKLTLLYI